MYFSLGFTNSAPNAYHGFCILWQKQGNKYQCEEIIWTSVADVACLCQQNGHNNKWNAQELHDLPGRWLTGKAEEIFAFCIRIDVMFCVFREIGLLLHKICVFMSTDINPFRSFSTQKKTAILCISLLLSRRVVSCCNNFRADGGFRFELLFLWDRF